MPSYHVERSITINANSAKVLPAIEDFREWPRWSPWLCMEPSAKLDYAGTPGTVGHGYDWDGELVGEGHMEIASLSPGKLHMDLAFVRPFKSKAKVLIEIKSQGEDQTEVTWHMDGSMPFFLFFMIGMMKTMIGMDYTRGLKMLKECVETGKVKSKTEIVGVVDSAPIHYFGVEARCEIDDIGASMQTTMPQAFQAATDNQLEMAGPPGALYHEFDPKTNSCHYTTFMQTKTLATVDGFNSGTIESCKALKVIHTGSYDHLGNAWGAAMSMQRHKKMKQSNSQCPFELYLNDPRETPEEELVTEIFIPVQE